MPSTYTVVRSARIHASSESLYRLIADFHRWTEWSPWEGLDPDLQRTYSGPHSGRGTKYAWSGNRKAGEGRMEIIGAAEPSEVSIALEFLKPFKSASTTTFSLEPDEEATGVTWTMTGPKTPMLRLMGIFTSMDKMIGPDFEKGLEQLKTIAERP